MVVAEILLLLTPVFGHVQPMLEIARELFHHDRLSGLANCASTCSRLFYGPLLEHNDEVLTLRS